MMIVTSANANYVIWQVTVSRRSWGNKCISKHESSFSFPAAAPQVADVFGCMCVWFVWLSHSPHCLVTVAVVTTHL